MPSASRHGSQVATSHGCSGWLHLLHAPVMSELIHKPFNSVLTLFGHCPYRIELSRERADLPGCFADTYAGCPVCIIALADNAPNLLNADAKHVRLCASVDFYFSHLG